MCLSPLVEVLGSYRINALCDNHVQNTGSLGRLPVCTLIRDEILCEFGSRKIFTIEFPGICW